MSRSSTVLKHRAMLLGSTFAFLLAPGLAAAQEGQGEDIVVTGFRAQHQLAVDAKRDADIIAEFVKSDDIGHRSPPRMDTESQSTSAHGSQSMPPR